MLWLLLLLCVWRGVATVAASGMAVIRSFQQLCSRRGPGASQGGVYRLVSSILLLLLPAPLWSAEAAAVWAAWACFFDFACIFTP